MHLADEIALARVFPRAGGIGCSGCNGLADALCWRLPDLAYDAGLRTGNGLCLRPSGMDLQICFMKPGWEWPGSAYFGCFLRR